MNIRIYSHIAIYFVTLVSNNTRNVQLGGKKEKKKANIQGDIDFFF